MTHNAVLTISKREIDDLKNFLENGGMSENETISYTVRFLNGYEMDIKVCGADEEPAWTEAVLFDENGTQSAYSDPSDEITGEWELEDNYGNFYSVTVIS